MAKGTRSEYQKFLDKKHGTFRTPDRILNDVVVGVLGSPIAAKKRLILGEVNEVYDVRLRNGRSIIIRISRWAKPRFEPERWCFEQCRKVGLPVPEVLAIETKIVREKKLTFCIETKLKGTPLNHLPAYRKNKKSIKPLVVQAGRLLSDIHSIKTRGFGWLDMQKDGSAAGPRKTLRAHMLRVMDRRKKYHAAARKLGIDTKLIDKALAEIKRQSVLCKNVQPQLLYNDFSPKHILIHRGRITGLIDFENCMSGDPVLEFARWDYFHGKDLPVAWVKQGYRNKSLFKKQFEEKLLFYRIYLGLIHMQYYVDQKNPPGMRHAKERFLADIQKV